MLRLYTGVAGTGKTREILGQIRQAAEEGKTDILLIVPDQFTYEAERELCEVCGNHISMHAAAKSFSRMAMQMLSSRPDCAPLLDNGGRLLCMNLAIESIGQKLAVYGNTRRRPENQKILLQEMQELKTSCITADMLIKTAESCSGLLRDKLEDLALIQEAYESVVANGHSDPSDLLNVFADSIPNDFISEHSTVYIDGFSDFSQQELNVIETMLRVGAEVTVCLNMEDSNQEIFEMAKITKRQLERIAEDCGIETEEVSFSVQEQKNAALAFYNEHLFSYEDAVWNQDEGRDVVALYSASTPEEECEFAAATCLQLVRETGCRWRDIAIAVRGFEEYDTMLECMFRHYDVPLYLTRRSDLLAKSLPSLLRSVYENVAGGWDTEELLEYVRTGLTGLSPEEGDLLENYTITWNLRGREWLFEEPWNRHPGGYGCDWTDRARQTLSTIQMLRRKIVAPLKRFYDASVNTHTVSGHTENLVEFLENSQLPQVLRSRAQKLREEDQKSEAEEYEQIWEILLSALEQMNAVMGDVSADVETYGKLLLQMLSQYDIGTIPVSLDSVSAGDFERMRRRNIRYLIVLGASEDQLPRFSGEVGVFTEEEKQFLRSIDLTMGRWSDLWLWKEYFTIYNTFTLPQEKMLLCYSRTRGGDVQEPSVVMRRAQEIFGGEIRPVDIDLLRSNAERPAAEMAAEAFHDFRPGAAAARARLQKEAPEQYEKLQRAAHFSRGSLTEEAVSRLYGKTLRLSPSRIDTMAGCPFSYFMQYGMKAEERQASGITPAEIGTFMHYVLEHVAKQISEEGGFHTVTAERIHEITDQVVEQYVEEEMAGLEGQSKRFRYLFGRLRENVHQVVGNMAEELRVSEFVPIEFELNFSEDRDFPAMQLGDPDALLQLTGIADRIDGWEHDGKLYLRVVDYKTGKKKFDLSEVWFGRNLQMLLYLNVLWKYGENKYGKETEPAGVLYIPARDTMLSMDGPSDAEKTEKERTKELKRSGLVLNDEGVLEAMERGMPKRFVPVSAGKDGVLKGSIADIRQFDLLMQHVEVTLTELTKKIREGNIDAQPWYRNATSNGCNYCAYREACHFENGNQKDSVRYMKKFDDQEIWSRIQKEAEDRHEQI